MIATEVFDKIRGTKNEKIGKIKHLRQWNFNLSLQSEDNSNIVRITLSRMG